MWQLHATEVAALAQALARLIIYDHASISWGRHAELFAYDDGAGELYLES